MSREKEETRNFSLAKATRWAAGKWSVARQSGTHVEMECKAVAAASTSYFSVADVEDLAGLCFKINTF